MTSPVAAPLPDFPAEHPFWQVYELGRIVGGLRDGESVVVDGRKLTYVSPPMSDALDGYRWASRWSRRLSGQAASGADFERLLFLQDVMGACRCRLADAGLVHLLEG
ncbi:hypothetical protein SRB5_51790 [Streptomyces sp. RB5]|uniref:Uncharacterized protein n=1 Tax=Streptomyces smaragdinus TaxID=2585196 RepID=A0A7K0CPQ5_9ACTN|nr:hypothetical protein [Streptomyces smaragdinus]MQY15002.1 hypothetical protein [Streptomyces smaragdinus]